jgi:hypothetical protein
MKCRLTITAACLYSQYISAGYFSVPVKCDGCFWGRLVSLGQAGGALMHLHPDPDAHIRPNLAPSFLHPPPHRISTPSRWLLDSHARRRTTIPPLNSLDQSATAEYRLSLGGGRRRSIHAECRHIYPDRSHHNRHIPCPRTANITGGPKLRYNTTIPDGLAGAPGAAAEVSSWSTLCPPTGCRRQAARL